MSAGDLSIQYGWRVSEAAREYERLRRAHLDHGPLLSARKAARDALIAAVEAERVYSERGEATMIDPQNPEGA